MFDVNEAQILVTGAAGFIGSHLTEKLLELGAYVRGIDNFITGDRYNVDRLRNQSNFEFIEGNMSDEKCLKNTVSDINIVFHLAVTRPNYEKGILEAMEGYKNDVLATYNLLKSLRKKKEIKIVFTSSGLIYGNASVIPTPESYGPLEPISPYDASKLASEAFISTFCHTFNMEAAICRLANTEGPRKPYGVVYDFIKKLNKDKTKLVILGNPEDKRAYLYVSDCIDGLIFCLNQIDKKFDVWNIGPGDNINVKTVSNIIINEMGLKDISIITNNSLSKDKIKGKRKESLPSIQKLQSFGWTPNYNSEETIKKAASKLIWEFKNKNMM